MDQAPISVIIPVFNRRDSLDRTLVALAHQTLPPTTYEVVLACGRPADGACAVARNTHLPYQLRSVCLPHCGRNATRLYGMRAAAGALLLLLDDDLEPAPVLLAAHLLAQSEGTQQVVIGAVQRRGDAAPPTARATNPTPPIYEAATSNLSVPRSALRKAGLLSEPPSAAQADEADLLQRLRCAGLTLVYHAEALAYQQAERSTSAMPPEVAAKGPNTAASPLRRLTEPTLQLAAS